MFATRYKSCIRSMDECKDAPLLSRKEVYWFNSTSCGATFPLSLHTAQETHWLLPELANPADPYDPSFSPLLLPSHANLPPLFFMSCGWDPLRDEGLLYHALLKEAGVETKMTMWVVCVMLTPAAALIGPLIYRYPGVPHAFHSQLFSTLFLAILPDVSIYQQCSSGP